MKRVSIALCAFTAALLAQPIAPAKYADAEYCAENQATMKKCCDMDKDAMSCGTLGQDLYNEGKYEKSIPYLKISCDQDGVFHCVKLGDIYYIGQGTDANFTQAAKYYEMGCEGDGMIYSGGSCDSASYLYEEGSGVKQDYDKAFRYAQRSCESKFGGGCYHLGHMYYNGHGVKEDLQKAKEYFALACDLENQKACEEYKKLKNRKAK